MGDPEAARAVRILVAEDSEDSFQLFKAYLHGQPVVLSRAVNGAEAVEFATTGTFDLVFMDIHMPVMDGYEATNRIREWETDKDRQHLPIVVLSADDLTQPCRQDALGRCSGYLSKPYHRHELLEAIRLHTMPPSRTPVSPIPVPIH